MPSQKKRRKTAKKKKPPLTTSLELPPTLESTTNASLPDDLLVSCFARVSKLYYPTLSLVSKSFRSLLTSLELHESRNFLNRTERCLFVCLRFSPDPNPRWFTLSRKPDQKLNNDKKKKEKSSGYVLAPIPIPNYRFPQAPWKNPVVAVDSNIYAIGGPIIESSYRLSLSTSVSVFDCRSYTWHEAPSMRVERSYAAANVFNGKIYVVGGCKTYDSSNWMEVFDPKTQTWELVSSPFAERSYSFFQKSAAFEGEIYFYGEVNESVVYKPKEDRWEAIERCSYLDLGWSCCTYCVIDNLLYSYREEHGIRWYDSNIRRWVNLKGLKEVLPKNPTYSVVKLVDYGGKMAVLWYTNLRSDSCYLNKMIWCAVIALEKRNNNNDNSQDIWGKIEWVDGVLTVPNNSFEFLGAVAATV